MKPKMAIFQSDEFIKKNFSQLNDILDISNDKGELTELNAEAYCHIDIICVDQSILSSKILKSLKNLKLVALRCTGSDHIDIKTCKQLGIKICNAPGYAANSVAEHTFAMILGICRKMEKAQKFTRNTIFSWEGMQGMEIQGKTLGIIGTGAIGKRTAKIASGFDMEVIAYDLFPDQKWAQRANVAYYELNNLLSKADIITLCIPAILQEKHQYLLAEEQFNQMKKGVIIINTARGELIDNKALLKALDQGIVSSAGLDVLPLEHYIRQKDKDLSIYFKTDIDLDEMLTNYMLCQHPNVLMTPHTGWFSKEADQKALDITINNIRAFINNNFQNIL